MDDEISSLPRIVRTHRILERYEAAPRSGIASHVDVHVVIGPIVLVIIIEGMSGVR